MIGPSMKKKRYTTLSNVYDNIQYMLEILKRNACDWIWIVMSKPKCDITFNIKGNFLPLSK